MSILPLAIAVGRMHYQRAKDDDDRRAARTAATTAKVAEVPHVRNFYGLIEEAMATERPDLEDLCRKCGIEIRPLPLRADVAGWIDCGARAFIVNDGTNEQRRRFTIAHQIGHWFFNRDLLLGTGGTNADMKYRTMPGIPFANPAITDAHNTTATKFAIRLLMPADVVRRLAAHGLSMEEVAERLCVMPAAMAIRYDTLALNPKKG
jgi:hypothetical protein